MVREEPMTPEERRRAENTIALITRFSQHAAALLKENPEEDPEIALWNVMAALLSEYERLRIKGEVP